MEQLGLDAPAYLGYKIMNINEFKNIEVSTEFLSKLFDRHKRNINELNRLDKLPKISHNKYNLFDTLKMYFDYKEELHQKEITRIKSSKPQDQLARTNEEIKKLHLEELKGNLIDIDSVIRGELEKTEIFKTAVLGMGAKIAVRLKGMEDVKEIRNIIDGEVINSLNKISNSFNEKIELLKMESEK